MDDPHGAFLAEYAYDIEGGDGPLAGVAVAVKDVFDLAGRVTGNGQPTWRATHGPADSHAPVVRALIDAGARLIGPTVNDELCYSLNGGNIHYGAPVNPRTPDRLPGGSSCGSAVAVAGGLADAAIGTDCAGSVRVPAAFCGVFGIRPTFDRVSARGVFALAPSFDAVGWFAREAALMAALGRVLIPDHAAASARPARLLVAGDLFDALPDAVAAAQRALIDRVASSLALEAETVTLAPDGIDRWADAFRILQAREVTANLGPWVAARRPALEPAIAARLDWAATVTAKAAAAAQPRRDDIAERLAAMLAGDALLCLPTAGIAPPLDATAEALEDYRWRTLKLSCAAGLAGTPQLHLPLGAVDGCPIGLSLMARRGGDEMLLACAERIA